MSLEGRIGFYRISPSGDLAATARLVGQALRIGFQQDSSGRFEEIPAYVGTLNGWNLALLGSPSPEDELSDESSNEFELQLQVSVDRSGYDTSEKIDRYIIQALSASGVIASLNGWGT